MFKNALISISNINLLVNLIYDVTYSIQSTWKEQFYWNIKKFI